MPSYPGDGIEQSCADHEQGPSPINRMPENVHERHALSETFFLVDGCLHIR